MQRGAERKKLVVGGECDICEVRDALKQVGLSKSPELNLRISQMVSFLTEVLLKESSLGVIILPKKAGRHLEEERGYYQPITQLNTE